MNTVFCIKIFSVLQKEKEKSLNYLLSNNLLQFTELEVCKKPY